MPEETKYTASVKVMRSYDYCHFEVNLGSTEPATLETIDAMRKEAARLADKAVEQYKTARTVANIRGCAAERLKWDKEEYEAAKQVPEGERTPEQKAEVKRYEDNQYRASRCYDYEDDWSEAENEDDWDSSPI